MSENSNNGFNWKYFVPFYGAYVIHKTDGIKKGKWYFINIAVTFVLLAILSGGGNDTAGTGNTAVPDAKTTQQAKNSDNSAGKLSRDNYNKIRNGMTQNQVKALLGSPESTSESEIPGIGMSEMWHYQEVSFMSNTIEGCQIYFQNGKVSMKSWTKL